MRTRPFRAAALTRSSVLVRNTGWMLLSQGASTLARAGYFVLMARALGASGFGALAAALAIVFVLVPFAGWGAGNVLVMKVAREPGSFARAWGDALLSILVSGVALTVLTAALAHFVVPRIPLVLPLVLGVSEFFFGRVTDVSAQAFQGLERMLLSAGLGLLPSVLRLLAVAVFVALSPSLSPEGWAVWYLGATAIGAAVSAVVVTCCLGRPRLAPRSAFRSTANGGYFSLALASSTIYADVDKAMLARMTTLETAGVYAAGYRIMSLAFVPVLAMLSASYARFFRHGARGIDHSLSFARRLAPVVVGYGACASLALLALAPLARTLLGADYGDSVGAVRWLAAVPLVQSLYYLAGDTLSGAGYQRARSGVQLAAAGANVLLNLWLIPRYSWQGAAWATVASAVLLAGALWATVALLVLRADREENLANAPRSRLAGP